MFVCKWLDSTILCDLFQEATFYNFLFFANELPFKICLKWEIIFVCYNFIFGLNIFLDTLRVLRINEICINNLSYKKQMVAAARRMGC